MTCAVIFGGTGFIGTFFARHLVEEQGFEKVYLYDCQPLSCKSSPYETKLACESPQIIEVLGDVRQPIDWQPGETISLTANFAAVHREPGHADYEYYETNLLGAEHVCAWVERVGCQTLIFTSSISPYGPSEAEKDEHSLPVPATAYGGSKLAAEKIHQAWLAVDAANRHLVIVRPGVVFGPGEGGNVSRLIRAVLGRYFFFMGNRETRKAGVYVKELCAAVMWVLARQKQERTHYTLFNMTMNPAPSLEEYVDAVCAVAGKRSLVPSVPYSLLLSISYVIDILARPFGVKHPFSPVRIQKLVRSNNVFPDYLVENEYPYRYTLLTAFQDWKQECPEEWS
ncbi:MAG: NAD(P)-dependent oxidoreductase [Gammaproteobacteria bacterium]|nr:MAG: NAD(P)-dependent oxidoreductase [Gammaproteobacteria bacterium]